MNHVRLISKNRPVLADDDIFDQISDIFYLIERCISILYQLMAFSDIFQFSGLKDKFYLAR